MKNALNKLIPLCSPKQRIALLMNCIGRKAIEDVAVCLRANIDPYFASDKIIEFGAEMVSNKRHQFVEVSPYALMLNTFKNEDWVSLESLYPEISGALNHIPVLAKGGRNGMDHDGKSIDMVSLCFLLDLCPATPGSNAFRDRLTRVLSRLSGEQQDLYAQSQGLFQLTDILKSLGDRYQTNHMSSFDRDKCLMLSQVALVAGEAARPWVASIFCEAPAVSPVSLLVHDLAKLSWSNPFTPENQELAIKAICRLVDLGFPVDHPHPTKNTTPLMMAAASGNLEMMGALLDLGADIDAKDGRKWTARSHANKNAKMNAMALLDAYKSRKAIDGMLEKASPSI